MMPVEPFISRLGRLFHVPTVRRAFNLTFRAPPAAEYVLPDIAEFCYARDMMPKRLDEFERGRWLGRHDVWLHIQEWLNLTDEEVADILRGRSIFVGREVEKR